MSGDSSIERAIRDIAQAQIDDQVQALHDRIEQVAAAEVPLADADVAMIRELIHQVQLLSAQFAQFQQAMTTALDQLHAKGAA